MTRPHSPARRPLAPPSSLPLPRLSPPPESSSPVVLHGVCAPAGSTAVDAALPVVVADNVAPKPARISRDNPRARAGLTDWKPESPTPPQAHAGDLSALAAELKIQFMQMDRRGAAMLSCTSHRWHEFLRDNIMQIRYPNGVNWSASLLQDLNRIKSMDQAMLEALDIPSDPDWYDSPRALIESICDRLALLVGQGASHFTPENQALLSTAQGNRHAMAQHDFLRAYGSTGGSVILRDAMPCELFCAFRHCAWVQYVEQGQTSGAHVERARYGLLGFLNALLSQPRPPGAPAAQYAHFVDTLRAYEVANPALTALLDQPDSPWYQSDYPRAQAIEAASLDNRMARP
ncbi:MAG: hypothetical protein ACRYGK_16065 [Janthinobacterium lividum]